MGFGGRLRGILALWFGFSAPVSRRAYLTTGLALMGFKYLVEALLVHAVTGRVWTPRDYLVPSIERFEHLGSQGLSVALVAWTLPFMWIGASMTVRRAAHAGVSPGVGLLFFVPVVNHVVMLLFAALPPVGNRAAPLAAGSAARGAFLGVLAGVLIVVAAVLFSVTALRSYGAVLFLGVPFVVGFVAGSVFNRRAARSAGATAGLAVLTIVAASGVLVSLALEGAVCLIMGFPIASVLAILGALFARPRERAGLPLVLPIALVVTALPALLGATSSPPGTGAGAVAPREVISAIDVDAPPDTVWNQVVSFADLPPPTEWEFRAGVAYPLRARIDGRGVGAIRRCEFSTGAFVEPITVWDQPRRLAFDVSEQPPGLRELSPYDNVHAPHVAGYLRSKRGEFRLRALPNGRTHLEGSTFYELDVFPGWYWSPFADAIIGRIHQRVLRHIKGLAEAAARAS